MLVRVVCSGVEMMVAPETLNKTALYGAEGTVELDREAASMAQCFRHCKGYTLDLQQPRAALLDVLADAKFLGIDDLVALLNSALGTEPVKTAPEPEPEPRPVTPPKPVVRTPSPVPSPPSSPVPEAQRVIPELLFVQELEEPLQMFQNMFRRAPMRRPVAEEEPEPVQTEKVERVRKVFRADERTRVSTKSPRSAPTPTAAPSRFRKMEDFINRY